MLINFQTGFSGERCGPWASCIKIGPVWGIFVLLSPLREWCDSSFEQWNSFHPKMVCANSDRNLSSGFGEDN